MQYSGVSSAGSLSIICPGESFLNAPEGYELEGWTESPNASKAEHAPGKQLGVRYGELPHFYAVWKAKTYESAPESE